MNESITDIFYRILIAYYCMGALNNKKDNKSLSEHQIQFHSIRFAKVTDVCIRQL